MARYGSKDVAFLLADGYELAPDLVSLRVGVEAVTQEATGLMAAWPSHLAVLRRASLETDGYYDDRADGELAAFVGSEGIPRILCVGLNGNVIGRQLIGAAGAMRARVTRVASQGDLHRLRGEWTLTGEVDGRAVILHPHQAETANGQAAPVDNGASSAAGGAGYLQVSTASGTSPSLTVSIEHSADNLTYVALMTFAAATTRGAQRLRVSGTVNRYVRAAWTVGGTSPSFTFAVGFERY